MVSKREVVPQDELASESCLHCEINDLVQDLVEGLEEPVDIVALAANIAESLVDLILLAPEEDQAKLLAVTIGHVVYCDRGLPWVHLGDMQRFPKMLPG